MRFIPFAFLLASASAFTPQPPNTRVLSTKLYGTTKSPPPIPAPKKVSYGEESRKYRRTIYTHDDWVIHRSSDRFLRNILTTSTSGIYNNIGIQVASVTAMASFILLWNMATGTYTDLEGINHEGIFSGQHFLPSLALPLTGFTMSAPFLGLLLGKCS
jgi:putative membrane protein